MMARTILYLNDAFKVGDTWYSIVAGDFEEDLNKAGQSVMVSNTFAGTAAIPATSIWSALTFIPEGIAYTDIEPDVLVIS
jgi:hypothetical protein